MIQYRMHQPPEALSEYVRFFWSLEAQVQSDGNFVHRTLPDNCVELIFYRKGRLAISSADGAEGNTFASGFFGQTRKFRQFRTQNDFRLFGVYLYPYSFPVLFNIPAYDIYNQKVDIQTLLGVEGKMLEERVMLAHSSEQCVDLVSDFLVKRIRLMRRNPDGFFVRHIRSVIDDNSVHSISSFADDCSLSRRQLERKFSDFSGLTPKDFFSIARFKNVLREMASGDKSLARIALDTGYYDQSHLTNEFRRLSGYSPKDFVMNQADSVDQRATRDFRDRP